MRQCHTMASQRQRPFFSVFFCTLVLATSVGQVCATVDSTCGTTSHAFNELRVTDVNGQNVGPTGIIYERLTPESPSEAVCKIGETCCSSEAEDTFQEHVSDRVQLRVGGLLSNEVLKCHNQTFSGELINYIAASKALVLQAMNNAFGPFFRPYQSIFDEFYEYLTLTVTSGNTCHFPEEFNKVYFKMFTAAFFGHPTSGGTDAFPQTDAFNQCFYQYFYRNNADRVTLHYQSFTRTYNHTMYYLRALRYADLVLEQILDFALTDQCKNSLMRMSYCAQCAGYDLTYSPCQGLCLNSMRGCLLELGEVAPGFEQFSRAMLQMKGGLEGLFNPFLQITQIPSMFLDMIQSVIDNISTIKEGIELECDENGSRNKRSAGHRAEEEEETEEAQDAQPHVIQTRQAYDIPLVHLNTSAHCFRELLSVFTELPEALCGEEWVSRGNSECWTGRDMGSYGREVVGFNRPEQTSNPEVLICSRASHFSRPIRRLGKITQELDILTGRIVCNRDDEDCFFYQNTRCDFYDFGDIDSTLDEDGGVASAFFSGSGESPGCSDQSVVPTRPPLVTTTSKVSTATTTTTTDTVTMAITTEATTTVASGNDTTKAPTTFGTDVTDATTIFISRGVSMTTYCASLVVLLAAALSLLL